jgi:hypothetical protein
MDDDFSEVIEAINPNVKVSKISSMVTKKNGFYFNSIFYV